MSVRYEEQQILPRWLKALMVSVLLIAGVPLAASAHGNHADEAADEIAVASAAASETLADETSTAIPSQAYFENIGQSQKQGCPSACCCCQGMSQCGSSGGCPMGAAIDTASAFPHDLRSASTMGFGSQIALHFDPVFGLDRPPRV